MKYYFIALAIAVPIAFAMLWNSMVECQTQFSFLTCWLILAGK